MSTFKAPRQSAIEKSVHRRLVGTLATSAWISMSTVLLMPLAFTGPFDTDYVSILRAIREFIDVVLYGDSALFTTLTFGIVAASIAMYALTGSDRSKADGAEFIEREIFGVYISRINFILSILFGALLSIEIANFTFVDFQVGPVYVVISTLMGYFICGFLAGFHIRGEYLKSKSLKEGMYLRDWLRAEAQRRSGVTIHAHAFKSLVSNAFFSAIFATVASFSLTAIGLPVNGAIAAALFSLLYCSILIYMLYTVRTSAWDTRRSGRASQSLMKFVNSLVAVMIISSEIILISYFAKIDTIVKLLAIVVVWIFVVLITWFYWVASPRYRSLIASKQLRMIKSRIDSADRSIEIMESLARTRVPLIDHN